MALLDQKTHIIDMILTDRGKELLSENLLEFSFYAFSDEGMDYSGSLSSSLVASSSFDNYVHRDFSFEADQRRVEDGAANRSLESYLFTIPSRGDVLPKIITSRDEVLSSSLNKSYFVGNISTEGRLAIGINKPLAVVLNAEAKEKNLKTRIRQQALRSLINNSLRRRNEGFRTIGHSFANSSVFIGNNNFLNIESNTIIPTNQSQSFSENIEINSKKAEYVTGLDSVKIDLMLKTGTGEVVTKDGFLIEIFESGSDGKLKKINPKTVEDPVSSNNIQDGYDEFLKVIIDENEK